MGGGIYLQQQLQVARFRGKTVNLNTGTGWLEMVKWMVCRDCNGICSRNLNFCDGFFFSFCLPQQGCLCSNWYICESSDTDVGFMIMIIPSSQFFFFNESVDPVHKTCLNDSFTKYNLLNDSITAISDVNFSLFLMKLLYDFKRF